MIINSLDALIKSFGLNLCICYAYLKIINFKSYKNTNFLFLNLFIIILITLLCILQYIFKDYISNIVLISILYMIYAFMLSKIIKNEFSYSLISIILSCAITYTTFYIASFFILFLASFFNFLYAINNILFPLIIVFNFLFIFLFFKLKRFKNGFPFLKKRFNNDYWNIFILISSVIIIFMYYFIGNYKNINLPY